MIQSSIVHSLPILMGILLAALAIACLVVSSYLRRRSGLPSGEVVYDDASGRAGEPLISRSYRLSGKPDYLLEDGDEDLIPVEVKSGSAPRGGRPYRSHLLQLAVYFLLVEDVLQRPAPYGLIRYRDRTIRVTNTNELREELFLVIAEMRAAQLKSQARRSHNQPHRCASCSLAYTCGERLA